MVYNPGDNAIINKAVVNRERNNQVSARLTYGVVKILNGAPVFFGESIFYVKTVVQNSVCGPPDFIRVNIP